MTTTIAPAPTQTLVWLDPHILLAPPGNVRGDIGDMSELSASIKAVGVLQPLVVVPDDNSYRLVAGTRRARAAIAAGLELVPCWERPDLAGVTTEVAIQLVENEHRKALTVAERARGYHQLSIAGLSAAKIARATGTKPAAVKKALTVGGSELASTAADRYDLTFDQALALAEFADDHDAVKGLVVIAQKRPWDWDHTLSRLRTDRATAKARKQQAEALAARGLTVVDEDQLPAGAVPLHRLVASDGQRLTLDNHAHCPGHAVAVAAWDAERIEGYCLDPASHGHRDAWANQRSRSNDRGTDGKLTDEARKQRSYIIANNKAWRAAEPVRREHIKNLLARKTPPKDTLRYVTRVVLGRPGRLSDSTDDLLAQLLGVPVDRHNHSRSIDHDHSRHVGPAALAEAPDNRLPLLLLAQVAAAHEATMNVDTWRTREPYAAASWLRFLASTGYTLSAVEQLVVDTAASNTAPPHTDPDDTADGQDSGDDQP